MHDILKYYIYCLLYTATIGVVGLRVPPTATSGVPVARNVCVCVPRCPAMVRANAGLPARLRVQGRSVARKKRQLMRTREDGSKT